MPLKEFIQKCIPSPFKKISLLSTSVPHQKYSHSKLVNLFSKNKAENYILPLSLFDANMCNYSTAESVFSVCKGILLN